MTVLPYTKPQGATVPDISMDSRHRWIVVLAEAAELAHAIANTSFVKTSMRGDEAAITAAILYGDEVGMTPMQSLAKIDVIDGRPALAAEAQRALIQAAGHEIWFEDMTITRVTVAGRRHGSDQVGRVTWTMDDAKRAGLNGKRNWRTYPRAMLIARASAELARTLFADAIGGLAATEELDDGDTTEPELAPETPEPAKATTRRRRTTRTPAVVAPPTPDTPPTAVEEPPLPDNEPEAPAKATQAQLRMLFAMFKDRGLTERDDRLDWSNQHLDRTIVSASELTTDEASRLLDALAQEPPQEATTPPLIISQANAEVLLGMRREAGVDDKWMRLTLQEIGVEIDGPVNRVALQQLTHEQAGQLHSALNEAIDAGLNESD